MTAEQLRNSLLQEAISGRLVPQDPNDEPASVLLEKIRDEKARLIKEGKLKKEKPSAPITDDEKPFEIPASWEWVRFGEYMDIIGGYAFPSDSIKGNEGPRVIRISDISEKGFVDKSVVRYKGKTIPEAYRIALNDILIAMTGGTVGKSLLVSNLPEEMYLNQRVAMIRNIWFNIKYIDTVIKAPHIKEIINERKNSTNDNISMVDIKNFMLPLPPLAEQKRSVAKLEEILPIVEQYGKSQAELDELNAALQARLRQSILQQAIQGKLVPQDPNEGTSEELLKQIEVEKQQLIKEKKLKKEKPSAPITDDEKPFEIPASWEWVRIADICSIVNGFTPRRTEPRFWTNGTINWFTVEDINKQGEIIRYTEQKITKEATSDDRIVRPGSVLLCCTASVGRCAITEVPVTTNQQFNALTVKEEYRKAVSDTYILTLAKTLAPTLHQLAGQTTFEFVSVSKVGNIVVPLPPLAEQQRIVAKIEELFAEIDKLK